MAQIVDGQAKHYTIFLVGSVEEPEFFVVVIVLILSVADPKFCHIHVRFFGQSFDIFGQKVPTLSGGCLKYGTPHSPNKSRTWCVYTIAHISSSSANHLLYCIV